MDTSSYIPLNEHKKITKPLFYKVNILAAFAHFCNSIIFFSIYISNNYKDVLYDIKTGYIIWEGKYNIIQNQVLIGKISLNWLIISFHLLSFIFQSLVLIPSYKYQFRIQEQKINTIRFIEYSLSAPLMLIAIGLLCGITDFCIILNMAILTFVCMGCGAVCEYPIKEVYKIVLHSIGWVCILAAYTPIFIYFIVSNYEAYFNNKDGAPSFVYIIVITQFLLFQSFGLVQFMQLYGYKICSIYIKPETVELSYTLLSLISKTLLGWMIYSNVLLLGS